MRVIQNATKLRLSGGRHRGRFIKTIILEGLRPTTDANRQALFNILGDVVSGAKVADLYAGTGSFGFEALSRGADSVVFVEANNDLCELLEKNSETLGLDGVVKIENSRLEQLSDSFWSNTSFDIIFADPPYEIFTFPCIVPIARALKDDGVLIYEYSSRNKLPDDFGGLTLVKTKVNGDTSIAFYRKKKNE